MGTDLITTGMIGMVVADGSSGRIGGLVEDQLMVGLLRRSTSGTEDPCPQVLMVPSTTTSAVLVLVQVQKDLTERAATKARISSKSVLGSVFERSTCAASCKRHL